LDDRHSDAVVGVSDPLEAVQKTLELIHNVDVG